LKENTVAFKEAVGFVGRQEEGKTKRGERDGVTERELAEISQLFVVWPDDFAKAKEGMEGGSEQRHKKDVFEGSR
jgi:hypothetical protein